MKKIRALIAAVMLAGVLAFASAPVIAAQEVPYIPAATFQGLLHQQTNTPLLIQFGADWCPYCRKLQPRLSEFADENRGKVAVYRIDVDAHPELAQEYRVASLPTMIMFEGGLEAARISGVPSPAELQGWADSLD